MGPAYSRNASATFDPCGGELPGPPFVAVSVNETGGDWRIASKRFANNRKKKKMSFDAKPYPSEHAVERRPAWD